MKYFVRIFSILPLMLLICACQPIRKPESNLFIPISPTDDRVADRELIDDPRFIRQNYMDINPIVIENIIIEPAPNEGLDEPITLDLFPNVQLEAIPSNIVRQSWNTTNWTGYIEGSDQSNVLLTIRDGYITGDVFVDDKQYQIRPAEDGSQIILEIDQSTFPDEADPDQPESDPLEEDGSPADGDVNTPVETGSPIIDVLVLYTPGAKIAATGFITDNIVQAIGLTNNSFANQNLDVRVRLVYSAEVDYREVGGDLELDRNRLRDTDDDFLRVAHELRDQYGADVVSLWIANRAQAWCGRTYIMDSTFGEFSDDAFFVIREDCATTVFSFPHELGHILGARHDWDDDDTDNSPFTYNHGYVDMARGQRDIMSTSKACDCSDEESPCPNKVVARRTPNEPFCKRLPYWSDPRFIIDGTAFGIPSTETKAADNRLTISHTAAIVANYRFPVLPRSMRQNNPGESITPQQVKIVVPLETNRLTVERWVQAQEERLNIQVEVVTELGADETADIFILPETHASQLKERVEANANIVTADGGNFVIQTIERGILTQLANELATHVLPQLTLGDLPLELSEDIEITSESTGDDADICIYPCGQRQCVFLC